MTIGELADALKKAVDNGWEDYPVYVRKFGDKKENHRFIDFFDLVNNGELFGEIVTRSN